MGFGVAAPAAPAFVLPHDLDAERALIGSILQCTGPAEYVKAAAILIDGPVEFFIERHGAIFALVKALVDERRPIDGVVIKDELLRRKVTTQDPFRVLEDLSDLAMSVPSRKNIEHYAAIVHDLHIRRQAAQVGWKLTHAVIDRANDTVECIGTAGRTLADLAARRESVLLRQDSFYELLDAVVDGFAEPDRGLSTGMVELDRLIRLRPGTLTVIGARPSVGKSALALQIATHVALTDGLPVLLFSLEMSVKSLVERMISARSGLSRSELRRGALFGYAAEQKAALDDTYTAMQQTRIVIRADANRIDQIRALATIDRARRGTELIIVDYVGLVRPAPGQRFDKRADAVQEVSQQLKALALELGVPIIAVAQLNRESEATAEGRPRMSNLRESGSLEQDADVVLLLHRPEYHLRSLGKSVPEELLGRAIVIVEKNREGATGDVTLMWQPECTRFVNTLDAAAALAVGLQHAAPTGNGSGGIFPDGEIR